MEDNNESALTLGIFAHANAGKTTITEHLLYHASVIDTIGRVDNGDTVSDSMRVEKERGISVRASLASFKINGKKFQLIDTPGHIDFSAEVERAISVLDAAVLVVSGVEGVEAQTYTIWRALRRKKVPIIIFINKMDRLGANYEDTINELKEKLDQNIIPIFDVMQNKYSEVECKDIGDLKMLENISAVDDQILEQYINDPESVSKVLIQNRLTDSIQSQSIFPVVGGSALKSIGIDQLIKCLSDYISIAERNINDEFSAIVYSVKVNGNVKNVYAKILSGTIDNRSYIKTGIDEEQKIKGLFISEGTILVPSVAAKCGDIVVLNGIDAIPGQLIGNQDEKQEYISFVKPLINMQVAPKDKEQLNKLYSALKNLGIEDPYLNARYDKDTEQIYVSLMGEIQAQIVKSLLREIFGIDVEMNDPKIIHKETTKQVGKGYASYTTVSGVGFKVTPLEIGSGLIYKSDLSTDFLHRKYQRQAERLVKIYARQGLKGWELTDLEISLTSGNFDSMGSDPSHFNIAVPLALFRALKESDTKILEPIYSYIVTFPKEHLSKMVQCLSGKHGMFEITRETKEQIVIEGEATVRSMIGFPMELSKLASGRGTYSYKLSKYEVSHNQNIENKYIGPDPRNEVKFVVGDMGGSLVSLDRISNNPKRDSKKPPKKISSKFHRQQQERKIREETKNKPRGIEK